VAVGLGVIAGSSIITTSSMWGTPGGTATSLGTVAAMVGTYLCLVLLLFISRVPWLEREMGHDRMVVWHRTVAPLALALIFVHVALTGWGFAQAAQVNVGAEIVRLITTYPWMMPAAVAFGLMMLLGLASYRRVRSRMKYETWWASHLYFYLAVVLAFGHQIEGGTVLTQHPLIRIGWVALYVAVFGTILVSRFAIPVVSSLRHDLRVWQVVPEGHDMVSIYLTGRNLERKKKHNNGASFYAFTAPMHALAAKYIAIAARGRGPLVGIAMIRALPSS
jgi:DMSO/TMAO reductase YedYZ heme-binding membrane subunit